MIMKQKKLLLLLLFVTSSTFAQTKKSLFDVASDKYNEQNYAGAIFDLTQFIKLNPKHIPSRYLRARCYSIRDDYDKSIKDYLFVIQADKEASNETKSAYFDGIGYVYSRQGEYTKARENYLKANSLKGNQLNVLSNIGYTFRKDKLYDSSIVYFDKALIIDKSNVFTIRNKIQSLKALDNIDEAFRLSDEFLLTKNYDIDISLIRASILKSKGKTAEALNDYHRALTNDPFDYGALIGVSECYVLLGYYEEDLVLKRRMVEIFKANKESNTMLSNANYLLASAYKFLGDYRSAIETFDEAEALNPKDVGIFLERALAKASLKDFEGACIDFKKARNLDEEKANDYEEFLAEETEYAEFTEYCFPEN
jgi:tetratricopeptide (TPR) repeat protein